MTVEEGNEHVRGVRRINRTYTQTPSEILAGALHSETAGSHRSGFSREYRSNDYISHLSDPMISSMSQPDELNVTRSVIGEIDDPLDYRRHVRNERGEQVTWNESWEFEF